MQENWKFLAKIFNKPCYKVGEKYITWECTSTSIKASIFTDSTCETPDEVATDHPIQKEFVYDACTEYGAYHIKINQPSG